MIFEFFNLIAESVFVLLMLIHRLFVLLKDNLNMVHLCFGLHKLVPYLLIVQYIVGIWLHL